MHMLKDLLSYDFFFFIIIFFFWCVLYNLDSLMALKSKNKNI